MAISVQACLELVRHSLGGPLSSEIAGYDIVNQAQQVFVTAHPWQWLLRSTTLNLTASQNYINLPSDFRDLEGYEATSGTLTSLRLTTLQRIVELRSSSVPQSTFGYYAALAYSSASPSGAPTPRLEIYPTPTANSTAAFTIFYRIELPVVSNDQTFISIPRWCEVPFIQLVRAIARGYEEEDQASMQVRIATVKTGEEWQDALLRDGGAQPMLGLMRGGAVQQMYGTDEWNTNATSLANP